MVDAPARPGDGAPVAEAVELPTRPGSRLIAADPSMEKEDGTS